MAEKLDFGRDDGIVYSSLELNPELSYVVSVFPDAKYIDTTSLLSNTLSELYDDGKPLGHIKILGNVPPGYLDNVVVVNPRLKGYTEKETTPFFPLSQPEIDRAASDSEYVNKLIASILENQGTLAINVFKSTPEMNLADGDRAFVIGPDPELSTKFDDKVYQREIAKELGMKVPRGYVAENLDKTVELYESKRKFDNGAFVSSENGAGGSGSVRVNSSHDICASSKLRDAARKGQRFIITKLLDVESSPSSLGIVMDRDDVIVAGVIDQRLEGDTDYIGSLSPSLASDYHKETMRAWTEELGRVLGEDGYRGCFGVDFMITRKGGLYFAEINPRKIGSTLETSFAHRAENPDSPTIPELELRAVRRIPLEFDPSEFRMPEKNWGVLSLKAKAGYVTQEDVVREMPEQELFSREEGVTVLDYPGRGIEFKKDGRLARVVAVDGSRENIISMLDEQKERLFPTPE